MPLTRSCAGSYRALIDSEADIVYGSLYPPSAERFQPFGVLSDGACSFIVTRSSAIDFGIVAAAVLSCPISVLNGGQSFQEKFQLIHAVFAELDRRAESQSCAPSGIDPDLEPG